MGIREKSISAENKEQNWDYLTFTLNWRDPVREYQVKQLNKFIEKSLPGFIAHRHSQSVLSILVKKKIANFYQHMSLNGLWMIMEKELLNIQTNFRS